MRLNIPDNYDMKAVSSSVVCDTKESLELSLTKATLSEQQVKLTVFDLPLNQKDKIFDIQYHAELDKVSGHKNQYEIQMVKSLATTEDNEVF